MYASFVSGNSCDLQDLPYLQNHYVNRLKDILFEADDRLFTLQYNKDNVSLQTKC